MERGFEKFPGFDPERQIGKIERSPENEPSPDVLMEMFEDGRRFSDENAKEIDYNNRLDKADGLQQDIDEISEQISQATTALAGLPLTPEQQELMHKIEQLIAKRQQTKDYNEQLKLDSSIEQLTKQFASLPVTDEQAELLDSILEMIDAREATSIRLREVFGTN